MYQPITTIRPSNPFSTDMGGTSFPCICLWRESPSLGRTGHLTSLHFFGGPMCLLGWHSCILFPGWCIQQVNWPIVFFVNLHWPNLIFKVPWRLGSLLLLICNWIVPNWISLLLRTWHSFSLWFECYVQTCNIPVCIQRNISYDVVIIVEPLCVWIVLECIN